ncbi:MAG: PEP-CTERM sorting domain-containing protein [Terracidiphilus sp.]
MKTSAVLSVLMLGLVGAIAAPPAFADTLYSNGPTNVEVYSWPIGYGASVSDSFTLLQASTITGATFVLWAESEPLSVSWSIGTAPFDDTDGSATTNPVSTYDYTNARGWPIYTESISIPSLSLDSGTYWLTLQDAVTEYGVIYPDVDYYAYWDDNDGPSVAYASYYGNLNGVLGSAGSHSETFQILGTAGSATPEPSSFLLLGSGLAGLAGLLKRKFRA